MSAPAQNARSPAPVSTTTRTSRSPPIAVHMRSSSTSVARSTAFITSGRSIVTRATWSRTSNWTPTLLMCDARFRENFLGVLAQPRRCAPHRDRRSRHANWASHEPHRLVAVHALDDHAVVMRLRVGQRLAQVAHRRAQEILRLQPLEPVFGRLRLVALAKDLLQDRLVLDLRVERGEAGIARQVLDVERGA